MPTENRSSNTEQMVSVPMSTLEKCLRDARLVRFTCDKHVLHLQDLLAQPAAQHQGEPILIQAVAVTRKDDDEGLRLEWLLEGGIAEMEFAGQVLFAMPEANDLCDEDGSAEVFLHPPTSDGFSAGDMADQGAKAFAARDPEVEELRELLRAMTCGYRMAVQAGHARITALGGDCDGVDRMLADFPEYAKAIAATKRQS